jgi:hypothetical protein
MDKSRDKLGKPGDWQGVGCVATHPTIRVAAAIGLLGSGRCDRRLICLGLSFCCLPKRVMLVIIM